MPRRVKVIDRPTAQEVVSKHRVEIRQDLSCLLCHGSFFEFGNSTRVANSASRRSLVSSRSWFVA